MILKKCLCVLVFLFFPLFVYAGPVNLSAWQAWVQIFREEAITSGIRPGLFDYIFKDMQPSAKHIRLDRSQPETRLTYYKYRNTRGDLYRIKLGQKEYRRYVTLLNAVGAQYRVSPCFIVSLWGLESSYGRFMGNFDVIRSLSTLAYDGRRSDFFRKELLLALHMVNDGHIALKDFKGEWAGASGQSQFLPSSWHRYAVDYNLDGRKDIWKTHADIFASIANYLLQNGWQQGEPVFIEVILPQGFDTALLGYDHEKTVQEWRSLGIRIKSGQPIVDDRLIASMITPYGGPTMMVFNNFRVLLKWNYSSFYAGTVDYVAKNICRGV